MRALWPSLARAVAVLLFMGGGLWLYARHSDGAYTFEGTPVAPHAAPPLLLDENSGRPFSLAELHGKAVLVYFGYVHCPDVCPMTLAAMKPVLAALGPQASKARVVFVTLDPEEDDPATLARYLHQFLPDAIGLTGQEAAIRRAAHDWHVTYMKHPMNGMIDHSSVVTLVTPGGKVAALYGPTQLGDPQAIARDIRHVLGRNMAGGV